MKSATLLLFGILLCIGPAHSQDGVLTDPMRPFLDASGRPLANGQLYTYSAGTLNALPTYTDATGSVANGNPVTLDAGGFAGVWAPPGVGYRLILKTSMGLVIRTVDNLFAGGSSGGGGGGGSAAGSDTQVQYNCAGSLCGDTSFAWQYNQRTLTLASGGRYNAFTSASDGSFLRGGTISQNAAANRGGYLHLTPVTYNPYNSATVCHDIFGNVVTQPLPLTGDSFAAHDAVLWVSTSPLMPTDNSCGQPIGGDPLVGLNTNTYFLAMGGLATTDTSYNSIDSLLGGIHAKLGVTAEQGLYLLNHASSGTLNTPATGFGALAHQAGSVFWYYNDTSHAWATVDFAAGGGGGGSGLPLTGGTMSGPILVTGANDFGSSGSPWNEGWFHSLNATGPIQSDATGSAIAFQTQNTNLQIDGNGNISAAGSLNLSGGSSAYKMGGTTVVDASRNATVNNLTITGTCSGCPGSGSGSFLPIAGGTMTGAISSSGINTLDFGSALNPWKIGWFKTAVATDRVSLYDVSASDLSAPASMGITATLVSGNNVYINFLDSTSAPMMLLTRTVAGVNVSQARVDLDVVPITDNARDLGAPAWPVTMGAWRNIYYRGGLYQPQISTVTPTIDSAANGTFHNMSVNNLTVAGTCTGCGGGGGGAVSSISAVSPLVASASTGAVTVSCLTCGVLGFTQTWTGGNSFLGTTAFQNQITAQNISIGALSGIFQWGPGNSANLNSSGGAAFQSGITVNGSATISNGATVNGNTLFANQGILVQGNVITNGSMAATGVVTAGTSFGAAGHAGVTGSSCSHWTGGICDAL